METVSTLSALLAQAGADYRIYDLGRRVQSVDKASFEAFEQTLKPYPYPTQQHACFALTFWQAHQPDSPFVWFLKFPLDEQGKLIQATRNHYIALVLEAMGNQLNASEMSEKQQERLGSSPYNFTPAESKLAYFNALLRKNLKQPESRFYLDAYHYLAPESTPQEWQHLGLQGLADIAVRLEEKDHLSRMLTKLPVIPDEVLGHLAALMENTSIPVNLTELLCNELNQATSESKKVLLLRALSASSAKGMVSAQIGELLKDKNVALDLLIVIAGRAWEHLSSPVLMTQFLDRLAQKNQPEFFNAIYKELNLLPEVTSTLKQAIRDPSRSESLTHAVHQLFSAARGYQ